MEAGQHCQELLPLGLDLELLLLPASGQVLVCGGAQAQVWRGLLLPLLPGLHRQRPLVWGCCCSLQRL